MVFMMSYCLMHWQPSASCLVGILAGSQLKSRGSLLLLLTVIYRVCCHHVSPLRIEGFSQVYRKTPGAYLSFYVQNKNRENLKRVESLKVTWWAKCPFWQWCVKPQSASELWRIEKKSSLYLFLLQPHRRCVCVFQDIVEGEKKQKTSLCDVI